MNGLEHDGGRASAERHAAALRAGYRAAMEDITLRPVRPPRELNLDVLSFSCERDVPEQVASMRSLLRHAGRPAAITIVSDGSHSTPARELLARACGATVIDWQAFSRADLPACVRDYAASHPMGKKLAVELSLRVRRPLLYADADVLFYPGARELARLAVEARGWRYLPDCGPYLDERLLRGPQQGARPVNGGLFLLHRPLDMVEEVARLERLQGSPGFFSEQTLLHLAMHRAGARPLDRSRWVVSRDDEHLHADRHAGRAIAARHYTTPVRHKLWCALAGAGACSDR